MKKLIIIICSIIVCLSYTIQAQNSPHLWGMTSSGGQDGVGILFDYNNLFINKYTVQINLTSDYDGATPQYSTLLKASDGMLYGTTSTGGTNNTGVVYRYNPSNASYSKLYDFTTNFGNPTGGLIQASNGKIFGMTTGPNAGIFQIDIQNGTPTELYSFEVNNGNDGLNPCGSLLQASNGKLYGMTVTGGLYGLGVLFEFDPNTFVFTKKIDFNSAIMGSNPFGSLVQDSNGVLYGMTSSGGLNNGGILFEYIPSGSVFIKLQDFQGISNGLRPIGSLTVSNDGRLFGMTSSGGVNGRSEE